MVAHPRNMVKCLMSLTCAPCTSRTRSRCRQTWQATPSELLHAMHSVTCRQPYSGQTSAGLYVRNCWVQIVGRNLRQQLYGMPGGFLTLPGHASAFCARAPSNRLWSSVGVMHLGRNYLAMYPLHADSSVEDLQVRMRASLACMTRATLHAGTSSPQCSRLRTTTSANRHQAHLQDRRRSRLVRS